MEFFALFRIQYAFNFVNTMNIPLTLSTHCYIFEEKTVQTNRVFQNQVGWLIVA